MRTSVELGGDKQSVATTVDARTMISLLKLTAPEKMLSVLVDGDWIRLVSRGSNYKLRTLPAVGFPSFDVGATVGSGLEVPQGVLRGMLAKCANCMAQNDLRVFLNGVLIEVCGTELSIVSSTGHNMSVTTAILGEDGGTHRETIPRKIVAELLRLLDDSDDMAQISFANNQVCFRFGGLELVTRTLAGFPNWQRVLPAPDAGRFVAKVGREAFMQALKTCATVVQANTPPALILSFAADSITLRSEATGGQEDCEIAVDAQVEGGATDFGCNLDLLRNGLLSFEGNELRLSFKDANSAALCSTKDDANTKFVLMPLRLESLKRAAAHA